MKIVDGSLGKPSEREHKKLFPGNLGPSTGEMGTSMFWSAPNKLFNQTLKKMERALARERYVGYVD